MTFTWINVNIFGISVYQRLKQLNNFAQYIMHYTTDQ